MNHESSRSLEKCQYSLCHHEKGEIDMTILGFGLFVKPKIYAYPKF
jgi:hypothetical protein